MKKLFAIFAFALLFIGSIPIQINASSTDLINNASVAKSNQLLVKFSLNQEIDLTNEKSDIRLEYFSVDNDTLTPLYNTMEEDDLIKNKTWDGYLWTPSKSYSTGTNNVTEYSDQVPANVTLHSLLKYGAKQDGSMNYIDIDWSIDAVYAVKITVITNTGYGQSKTIYSDGRTATSKDVIPTLAIENGEIKFNNNMDVSFSLNQEIDLTKENADIQIAYFTKVNNQLIPVHDSISNTNLVKNKLWSGYLSQNKTTNYSSGAENANYSDLVPSFTKLSSRLQKGFRLDGSMDYIEINWDQKATYVVKITVTNGDGESATTTLEKTNPGKSVVDQINDADEQATVTLDEQSTAINLEAFEVAKDNNTNLTFEIKNVNNVLSYSWTFEAKDITNPIALDLKLTVGSSPKQAEIKEKVKDDSILYLSFTHHGDLPAPATIKVYVGNAYKTGDVTTLYYYNETTNEIETIQENVIVDADGYVTFQIEHCSEYFLTLTPTHSNPQTNDINVVFYSFTGVLSLAAAVFLIRKF